MKFETKFITKVTEDEDPKGWGHFAWSVKIGPELFTYRMGLAHCTQVRDKRTFRTNKKPDGAFLVQECGWARYWAHTPKQDEVLHSLFLDAQCGSLSFNDFCSEFGYDNDSLSALDTYRACMESGEKLRRALGPEYTKEKERIEKLEL